VSADASWIDQQIAATVPTALTALGDTVLRTAHDTDTTTEIVGVLSQMQPDRRESEDGERVVGDATLLVAASTVIQVDDIIEDGAGNEYAVDALEPAEAGYVRAVLRYADSVRRDHNAARSV